MGKENYKKIITVPDEFRHHDGVEITYLNSYYSYLFLALNLPIWIILDHKLGKLCRVSPDIANILQYPTYSLTEIVKLIDNRTRFSWVVTAAWYGDLVLPEDFEYLLAVADLSGVRVAEDQAFKEVGFPQFLKIFEQHTEYKIQELYKKDR